MASGEQSATPYEVLGVPRAAKAATVTAAYRALARRHHPDRGGDARRFRAVQEAYEVLGDAEARAAYDAEGEVERRRAQEASAAQQAARRRDAAAAGERRGLKRALEEREQAAAQLRREKQRREEKARVAASKGRKAVRRRERGEEKKGSRPAAAQFEPRDEAEEEIPPAFLALEARVLAMMRA